MRWARGKFITSWPEPDFEVVYFLSAGGLTKIGRAGRLFRRVIELANSTAAPLLLEGYLPGGAGLEAALHRHFASARQHGEWFRQSRPLRALLNRLQPMAFDVERLRGVAERFWREPPPQRGWLFTGADRRVPVPRSLLPEPAR